MQILNLPLCIGLLLQQSWLLVTPASASVRPTAHSIVFKTESTPSPVILAADIRVRRSSAKSTSSSLFRRKRQSRCVACYEDRRRHGHRSGSTADDGNWYQPGIGNYNERSLGGERDYERFDSYDEYNRDRNNDYIPRTYDRYEEHRFDDRLGSYPDRGQRRDYGYDTRAPYFGPDHYTRTDVKTSDKFDVPAYERNYGNRYDFRNYRPRDETYRGQSGLDSSRHGYYFSSNEGSRPGLDTSSHGQSPMRESSLRPYGRPVGNPCRVQVSKCPYDENFASGSLPSTAAASYQSVHSGRHRGSGTSVSSTHKDGSGWSYLDEKESGDGEIDRDRSTEGNTQSSPYSRPRRPLGGSYPFDRERSVVLVAGTGDDARVGAKPQVEKNAPKNTA